VTITEKEWTCDVKLKGCVRQAAASWICKVEGVQISACRFCWEAWKGRAQTDPSLANRCPRCEIRPVGADRPAAKIRRRNPEPLTGVIAEALELAMYREGILIDTRKRVMLRLGAEAAWLGGPKTEQA
jgi:hypothetical protein